VIVKSLTLPPDSALKDTVVVTVSGAAWLGVANATLASKPAATVKKNDRFVIEISSEENSLGETSERSVFKARNSMKSIPAMSDFDDQTLIKH
jgi:hypothetical protein